MDFPHLRAPAQRRKRDPMAKSSSRRRPPPRSTPSEVAVDRRAKRLPLSTTAWIGLSVFCGALFWWSVPSTVDHNNITLPIAFIIVTVQCSTIALAIRTPIIASALHLGAVAATGVITRPEAGQPWPMTLPGLVALAALLAVLGVRERLLMALMTWWVALGLLVTLIVLTPGKLADQSTWANSMRLIFTSTLVVLSAAVLVGRWRRIRVELAAARRDVQLEQAQRRYIEERARIARELHDVVAHSMSIVYIQSASASYRLPDLDERAKAEFEEISDSARTALEEMRQVLGVLRGNEDPEHNPQPQVNDLPGLVESTARTGTSVDLDVTSEAHQQTALVQLTTYRIVQEALSNVVRHAPGAHARVRINLSNDHHLDVTVDNDASPTAKRAERPPGGGGQGLRGMRERVSMLGGELEHHEVDTGGFSVHATLPVNNRDHRQDEA